jgi:GH15 family glucan-1,4-alpha-glucosidase
MDRYPDIGEHGLIGDLQTAALVSTEGTIDWFCCPRFDSPATTRAPRPTVSAARRGASSQPVSPALISL